MTTEIEKTKRALYGCLDRIRRAGKHRKLTAEFEERLEEHLEELIKLTERLRGYGQKYLADVTSMREERDQIQLRLHAIDHAYNEQQKAIGIAGEELIRVQGIARQHLDDLKNSTKANAVLHDENFSLRTVLGVNDIAIKSLRGQLEARDKTIGELRKNYGRDREDCMAAEKLSDDFSEKLRDAQAVIGQQEQLITGQRLAIADLYMQRAGFRAPK